MEQVYALSVSVVHRTLPRSTQDSIEDYVMMLSVWHKQWTRMLRSILVCGDVGCSESGLYDIDSTQC